jgi:hypothetical protein
MHFARRYSRNTSVRRGTSPRNLALTDSARSEARVVFATVDDDTDDVTFDAAAECFSELETKDSIIIQRISH